MTLRMESGDDAVLGDYFEDAVLLAAAREPYALIEQAVVAAAALSGGAKPLSEKQLPPNLDVFGWCSWDRWVGGGLVARRLVSCCMWVGLWLLALLPRHLLAPSLTLLPLPPLPSPPPSPMLQLLLRRLRLGAVGGGAEPEQRGHPAPLGGHRRRLAVHRGG